MKNIGKFAVLGAVLAASSSFALADTVTFSSSSATVSYNGSIASSGPFGTNPNTFVSTGANTPTFNIGTGGVWSAPIGSSSWVSNNANSSPGGSYIAPNGYYTYTDTFTAGTTGVYTGTFNIMADDTVAVYLGAPSTINSASVPLILAGVIGGDSKCADMKPNCTTLDTISPFTLNLTAGSNELTFVVEQTGLSAEGLDFSGSVSTPAPTPEPSSLMLLGTGLVSAGGMLLRRRRVTA